MWGASEQIGRPSRDGVSPLLKIAEPLHLRNFDKPCRRSMLSGAIEESRIARVRGGLKTIKEGEGRDKRRDGGLGVGGRLTVETTRRDEAVRVTHAGRGVGGGLERNWGLGRGTILTV